LRTEEDKALSITSAFPVVLLKKMGVSLWSLLTSVKVEALGNCPHRGESAVALYTQDIQKLGWEDPVTWVAENLG
jgi:hypothetical protein